MQTEARRPEGLLPAAGVRVGASVQASAAARLPREALARGQRLSEQPKQLALRLGDILSSAAEGQRACRDLRASC